MPDVKVPLIGNVPRGALIMGGGAAVVVTGYLIYRHNKQSAVASAYGYGASAYGYGSSAYYGYGSQFASGYGAYGGAGMTPYPTGAEYGYGAYGYGYYNPYTGQWIGPTQQQPPVTPPTTTKTPGKFVTIGGKKYWYSPNKQTVSAWVGKGKKRRYVHTTI
jgi:hypothetical protein